MHRTSIKPMLNIRKDTANDRYTLVIQILRKRKRSVIFTPYRLLLSEFDERQGIAVPDSAHPEQRCFTDTVNAYLGQQIERIKGIVAEMERGKMLFDATDIAAAFHERYDNRRPPSDISPCRPTG